ncbi:MAG: hypothetical protein JRE28_07540 [Deltaproteobacteria bacterium]|nr:hypothetical protein [Deltaproteobacteria bacterium]
MKAGTQHNSPGIEKIKQALDPSCSYVIFEKASESADQEKFREIFDTFSVLNLEASEWKIYHDNSTGLALLVIKVDPENTDKILQDVLTIGLPNDMTCYSYGRCMKG